MDKNSELWWKHLLCHHWYKNVFILQVVCVNLTVKYQYKPAAAATRSDAYSAEKVLLNKRQNYGGAPKVNCSPQTEESWVVQSSNCLLDKPTHQLAVSQSYHFCIWSTNPDDNLHLQHHTINRKVRTQSWTLNNGVDRKKSISRYPLVMCKFQIENIFVLPVTTKRRDFDRPNTFAVRFSLVQVGSLWSHARSKSRSVHFGSTWRLFT